MMVLIDPPEGWKYGFPKIYNNHDNKSVEEWLVENGYPQYLVDQGMARYCWFTEILDDGDVV